MLAQCTALAHLDLSYNDIGTAGAERLAGVLGQCAALAHLDLCENWIEEDELYMGTHFAAQHFQLARHLYYSLKPGGFTFASALCF